MRLRRIAAYGVCRDQRGRVLLVHAADPTVSTPWLLPGGGLAHGEHPADAVVREVAEETGLRVSVTGVRDTFAQVTVRPAGMLHTDALVYDLAVVGGTLRPEVGGSTDGVRWVEPTELASLPLDPMVSRTLGPARAGAGQPLDTVAVPAGGTARSETARSETAQGPPERTDAGASAATGSGPRLRRGTGQRFAAYGLVTDPADRVLLTLIADGYPGAGLWHAPGGGTDFGEQPREGLRRELWEETGQRGRIGELLTVTHHHNRAALGPEGYPIDWHAVRATFRVTVDDPTEPRVLEADSSTAQAGWFTRDQAVALPLTDVAGQLWGVPPSPAVPRRTGGQ